MVKIGDLVDAEYVANIQGTVKRLRGIVVSVGEWQGQPTHSVQGVGVSTMQSTMPVHLVAPALSEEARAFTDSLHGDSRERALKAEQAAALAELEQPAEVREDSELVTITLPAAQLDALAAYAEYGVEEKLYDIDENHPYTEEEEAEAREQCALATAAVAAIFAARVEQETPA